MLVFPEGYYLTNKIYTPNVGDDHGVIKLEPIPIEVDETAGTKCFRLTSFIISWKVSIVEQNARQVGKMKTEGDGLDELMAFYGGMKI